MNYDLNSLEGGYIGDYIGEHYRGRDTRSLSPTTPIILNLSAAVSSLIASLPRICVMPFTWLRSLQAELSGCLGEQFPPCFYGTLFMDRCWGGLQKSGSV